jgi:hypothetical protein
MLFFQGEAGDFTSMTARRNRRKNDVPFDERLQKAANDARAAAEQLPHGEAREALLTKARQAETAYRLNEWLSLPGLHSPR